MYGVPRDPPIDPIVNINIFFNNNNNTKALCTQTHVHAEDISIDISMKPIDNRKEKRTDPLSLFLWSN